MERRLLDKAFLSLADLSVGSVKGQGVGLREDSRGRRVGPESNGFQNLGL